jgi:opacity protein-like surface antigen
MKKMIPTLLLIIGLCTLPLAAKDLSVGLLGGLRTVAESSFSDAYGSGLRLTPFVAMNLTEQISLGAAFSFGFSKDDPIGQLEDESTFAMSSLEVFGRYRFEAGKFDPYAKLGLGLHFYSQTVPAADVDFSESGLGFFLGAGGDYAVSDTISLLAELGYTILSVEPLTESINLGGFSIQVGAAYRFSL